MLPAAREWSTSQLVTVIVVKRDRGIYNADHQSAIPGDGTGSLSVWRILQSIRVVSMRVRTGRFEKLR